MNEKDELKALRLAHEQQFIKTEFVESLAKLVLDELTAWCNETIFAPAGGELKTKITLGAPNAGILHRLDAPFHPEMEIRLSLITEIYRDAFSFPIICKRIVDETQALTNFHEAFPFKSQQFTFHEAVPTISDALISPLLRFASSALCDAVAQSCDDRIGPNDVNCRFLMFELMLVWTFFHEIGHVVQRHNILRHGSAKARNIHDTFFEIESIEKMDNEMEKSEHANRAEEERKAKIAAQARELLADAEGLEFTLCYLAQGDRIRFQSLYLLSCSVGCMFQRFYSNYADSLEFVSGSHPHPVIRDEVANGYILNWIADYLVERGSVKERSDAAAPLAYSSVRASLMTGLFRSHRVEKRDDESVLPSYMRLTSKAHADEKAEYLSLLVPSVKTQASAIVGWHMVTSNCVAALVTSLDRSLAR